MSDHIPYKPSTTPSPEELQTSTEAYYTKMNQRRSVRFFSDKAIDKQVIENLLMTASTAPSGANKQPWSFCVVSNPDLKKKIREAAEQEEFKSYNGRMSDEWLQDLAQFGTDWQKPFLEIAPYLIIIFKRAYEIEDGNHKHPNYYVAESVGLACGLLLSAIQEAGLVALTHTPSPMDFLTKILHRPANERPFLLIPVGYPADDCTVPNITRKSAEEVITWY